MNSGFCSLTGARTLIDSNLVQLNAVDAGNIASFLMGNQPRGVSASLLPDILHEAVHHWCLNTPVGVALALVREELMEASLSDANAARMGRLLLRYTVVTEALRPVVEGLAYFAEFDAFPGSGHLRATPLVWLATIANPTVAFNHDGDGRHQVGDDLLRETLVQMRCAESTARRKDTLLAQPLDPRQRGGYLTGYLMVKGIYTRAAGAEFSLVRDRELWLCFLRAYVFHDAALAAAMLEPVSTDSDPELELELGEGIMKRLTALANSSFLARSLTAFDTAHGPSAEAGDDHIALGNLRESLDRYEVLVSAHLARLVEPAPEKAVHVVRRLTNDLLRNRDWICVASAEGRLVSKSDGSLKFYDADSGTPRLAMPPHVEPDATSIQGKLVRGDYDVSAALEFWVGPIGEGAAYLVASEKGAHAYIDMWTGDRPAVDEFVTTMRSNGYLVRQNEQLRATIDGLLAMQPWWRNALEIIDAFLGPALQDQAALAVTLFGGGEHARTTLWNDGFHSVFDDLAVLRAVSGLGLITSLGADAPDGVSAENKRAIVLKASLDGVLSDLELTDEAETELLL